MDNLGCEVNHDVLEYMYFILYAVEKHFTLEI